MKGGINKMMRNIAASRADNEFDKVSTRTLLNVIVFVEIDESDMGERLERTQRKTCAL